MKKKIGIFLIHGAGEATFKQQDKFIDKLNKKLTRLGVDTGRLQYQHADWYAPTQDRQDILMKRLNNNDPPLNANMLRRFTLSLISDMAIYGGMPNKPTDAYVKTHELVHKCIVSLKNELEQNAPLIVIASSLGTEIIDNYIWDRQHAGNGDSKGTTSFERFETMVGLFMFGNNKPIFAPSIDIDKLQPIAFPSPELPDAYKPFACWENIYDRNDPLGFPIKCINENYRQSPLKDVHMNVGGLLTSWNILSHLKYWSSRKVINRIAKYIQQLDR